MPERRSATTTHSTASPSEIETARRNWNDRIFVSTVFNNADRVPGCGEQSYVRQMGGAGCSPHRCATTRTPTDLRANVKSSGSVAHHIRLLESRHLPFLWSIGVRGWAVDERIRDVRGSERETPMHRVERLFRRIHNEGVGHRSRTRRRVLVFVGSVALVLAACSGGDDASIATVQDGNGTTTATTNTSNTSTTAALSVEAAPAIELTQTHEITGFGYSIDYPSRWIALTSDTITAIAETAYEVRQRFDNSDAPLTALRVSLDHRTVAFLQDLGLTVDNPSPDDLLEFNISELGWTDVRGRTEVELFGAPAVAARIKESDTGNPGVVYQGVRPDTGEIFLLGIGAPTDEELDAFLPVWEAMLRSIKATG